MTRPLPDPVLERWQPLRGGLVDLFYYDQEEFWFRDGRLLLRGNNGTGKSKVLALLLPFLLDGDLSPHRVEPDADPKKRMEWNLLLGGSHPHPERLGYTWLEFGRVDEQGVHRFRTLGCGMKAVSGRGMARHWFFVTEQRIGTDVRLVDATGTALTRDRLVDAIGDRGTVYDRARDYRRAVDEALFGLGEQRYGVLVDLLVQLRQPQLSKKPSEKALSDALTEALPPLDQAVIADVAEAFRSLEEDREALQAMTEARDAASSFLGHYRRYARIASRRRARQPRDAQSAYERTNRELAAAEAELAKADQDLAAARQRTEQLSTAQRQLQARDAALRESPEMRSAAELDRAADDARKLVAEARRLADEREQASTWQGTLAGRHADATRKLSEATDGLIQARAGTLDVAGRALVAADHTRFVDHRLADEPRASADLTVVRRDAVRLAERQTRSIQRVGELIGVSEKAQHALAEARNKQSELEAAAEDLAVRRSEATELVRTSGAEHVSAIREQLDRSTELRLPDPAATLAALELWVETLDGPNPARADAGAAAQAVAGELATADAGLEVREQAAAERQAQLTDEVARLERGEDTAPPVPHTRDEAVRSTRPGAPLWQLVDFAGTVGDADRAGVEAALEAAGILDAWVMPDGELIAAETGDVVLRPGATPAAANLGAALVPAVDREDAQAAAVTDDALAALLGSIGLAAAGSAAPAATAWVSADGRFRNGVLDGRWAKPAAEFIGRGARAAARRARLAELRAQLAGLTSELDDLAAGRRRIAERKATLATELAGLPGDDAVRAAHAQATTLAREHARLSDRQATANQAVIAVTAAAEGAAAALAEGAGDLGLPAVRAELAAAEQALADYRVALAGLWPATEAAREAARRAEETAEDLARTEASLAELTERTTAVQQRAAAADERHRTLLGTVGAAVAELRQQLDEVRDELERNEQARHSAGAAAERAISAHGKAEGRREQLTEQLEVRTTERAAATDAFRRFAETGLLAVALPDLEVPDPAAAWSPDPTVRLARRANDELADTDDDDNSWDRAQHRLNTELKALHDTLGRHGNRASADLREDGVVVEVEFQGRPASVPELSAALATEVADRERLLSEREREILENHLVNEVASTLQELIAAADAQVASMNAELESRPTSTGMRLRLQWRPREDGPSGLAEARKRLLRQTADAWSPDDQAAVGEFLQARIGEVRARNAAGTWLEHLSEALDYRHWNRFVIQRHQNGEWRSATGPASGGERVLAASVPLFAAASAHYASAGNPHAPRLVTLDEAFAGVDDNARAKYLGLLAAFDLDVVMTSEREWGCYPEVPALAISQLARTDGVDAVLVTNWEWDGRGRTQVERDVHAVEPAAAEPDPDSLWA